MSKWRQHGWNGAHKTNRQSLDLLFTSKDNNSLREMFLVS